MGNARSTEHVSNDQCRLHKLPDRELELTGKGENGRVKLSVALADEEVDVSGTQPCIAMDWAERFYQRVPIEVTAHEGIGVPRPGACAERKMKGRRRSATAGKQR